MPVPQKTLARWWLDKQERAIAALKSDYGDRYGFPDDWLELLIEDGEYTLVVGDGGVMTSRTPAEVLRIANNGGVL